MSLKDSDLTCVSAIMNNFKRKASPNRLEINTGKEENSSVAVRLDFDNDSFYKENSDTSKKGRWNFDESSSNISQLSASANESPWEIRRLKKELIYAKSKISSLESRVSQLHALRRELELVFEAEKNCFLKQQGRDQMMIQTLENRIAQLRQRESHVRDGDVHRLSELEDQKLHLEKQVASLRKEKIQLSDEVLELKHSLRIAESKNEDHEDEIQKLQSQLHLLQSDRKQSPGLNESSLLSSQNERLSLELKEAQRTIKDLQSHIEENLEASNNAKAHQQKLLKIPEMEKEIDSLRKEVVKLRDAVHNKFLLEEEVADLRQKCVSTDERIQRLVQLEADKQLLESKLTEWISLVKEFSSVQSNDDVCPSLLRAHLQQLQQSELFLSSELADYQTKLKSCSTQTSKLQAEVSRLSDEISHLKATKEQQGNLIRRCQRKIALLTGERNSYREQLDAYEKELTMPVSSQQQSSRCRIEALERSLEGYRELVKNLEADLTTALGDGGSGGLQEKLHKISSERDSLIAEKVALQKRVDELQMQIENQALKGDFNPVSTRVLHMRLNPVACAEEKKEKEYNLLKTENAQLRERIKVLQEGEKDDITCKVNTRLASSNSQEIQELREQIKSSELMIQRLKEVFKKTSTEFRDCVYNLLGYKVDRLQNKGGLFRLSSMYAESPNDFLLFKMEEDSTFTLLETAFSESIGDLIETHLRQQGSLPVFHAAVTIDLFSRQSMMMPSSVADDDDPIVVLD